MAGPSFTMARGAIAIILVAAVAVLVYGLRPRGAANAPAPAQVATNAPVAPPPTPPPAALDRAGFLTAAARAASAFASGKPDAELRGLIGRQFVVKIPFGCFGPTVAGQEDQTYWRAVKTGAAFTVGAKVVDWSDTPLRPILDPLHQAEAIEGFWIPRPWMLSDGCPAGQPSAAQTSEQSVGMAELYGPEAARTQRRGGRPYEVTKPATDAAAAGPFVLTVSGRISGFEDDQPFRCAPTAANARPACLAGVEFSRVAIETPKGELLAEWTR